MTRLERRGFGRFGADVPFCVNIRPDEFMARERGSFVALRRRRPIGGAAGVARACARPCVWL